MNENLQKLYNNLRQDYGANFNVDYDTFVKDMDDDNKRTRLYETMRSDYGDNFNKSFEEFSNDMGFGAPYGIRRSAQPVTPRPQQPQARPVQEPTQEKERVLHFIDNGQLYAVPYDEVGAFTKSRPQSAVASDEEVASYGGSVQPLSPQPDSGIPKNAAQKQTGFWKTGAGDVLEKLGAGIVNTTAGAMTAFENIPSVGRYIFDKAIKDRLKKEYNLDDFEAGKFLQEKGREISERGDRHGLMADPETGEIRKVQYSDLFKQGKIWAGLGEIMLTATESAPTSALAMTPGGLPLIALTAAGQKYNELDGNDETKDMPEWKKILNASVSGSLEGLTEKLGAKVDMKMIEPFLKKMTESTVKGILKKGGINALIQTITEGGEEVLSQLGENAIDAATGVTDTYRPLEGVLDAFVYGAGGGVQFGGVTAGSAAYRAAQQAKYNRDSNRLNQTLENAATTIQSTDQVLENIVNPVLSEDIDPSDDTAHVGARTGLVKAIQALDEVMANTGVNFNPSVVDLPAIDQKQVVAEVLRAENLTDEQKTAVVNYVSAASIERQLREARENRLNEDFQQAEAQLARIVNPKTGTLVTARIPGGEQPLQVIGGLSLKENDNPDTSASPWLPDVENSDEAVYYIDQDGKTQVTTADQLEVVSNATVDEQLAIVQQELQAREQQRELEIEAAVQQSAQAVPDLAGTGGNWIIGETAEMPDGSIAQVIQFNPDGTILLEIENTGGEIYEQTVQPGEMQDFGFSVPKTAENATETGNIVPENGNLSTETGNLSPRSETIPAEPEISPEEVEREAFMASLPVIESGKDQGQIDQSRMTPEQNLRYFEYEYGKDRTLKAAEKQVANLKKTLQKEQGKLDNNPFDIAQNQKVSSLEQELEAYSNYVNNARMEGIEEQKQRQVEQPTSVMADRQARADRIASEEAGRTGTAAPSIAEKWNTSPKVEGMEDIITLANGEKIPGRYVLTSAEAPSPSHDINQNFAKTVGFPVNEQGRTVNDRDYEADQTAQLLVQQRANNYDERAVQTPVVVSSEGIVLSGNDRTMAGQIAARNGTDGAYVDYITRFAPRWGFTQEQVSNILNPRIVFVPDAPMPYNTATFAKFNAEEKKTQNSLESAIKASKSISRDAVIPLSQAIERFDKLNDFYTNPAAVKQAVQTLLQQGIIQSNEVPRMMDGEALSAEGRSFFETLMLGSVLQEKALREVDKMRSVRQTLMRTMPQLLRNASLRDYSLIGELNNAIHLLYDARQSGNAVKLQLRQGNLFDATAEEIYSETEKLLSLMLEQEKDSDFRQIFETYNSRAVSIESGQTDIFDGILAKPELLQKILQNYGQQTEIIEQAGSPAAVYPRSTESGTQPADTGEGIAESTGELTTDSNDGQPAAGSIDESDGRITDQPEIPAPVFTGDIVAYAQNVVKSNEISREGENVDPNPTEAQKEAGNYKMGHVNVQGFDITIENPRGSVRSGIDKSGKEWSIEMQNHYGYFKRTKGKDGDHIDVFIGPNPGSQKVFVVDQNNSDGQFDESKVMLGFNTEEEARAAYLSNYEEGWQGLGAITETNIEDFKKWLYDGAKQRKAFSEYKENQPEEIPNPWLMSADEYAIKIGAPKKHIEIDAGVSLHQLSKMSERAKDARTKQRIEERRAANNKYKAAVEEWENKVWNAYLKGDFNSIDVYDTDAFYVLSKKIDESGVEMDSPFKISKKDQVEKESYLNNIDKAVRLEIQGKIPVSYNTNTTYTPNDFTEELIEKNKSRAKGVFPINDDKSVTPGVFKEDGRIYAGMEVEGSSHPFLLREFSSEAEARSFLNNTDAVDNTWWDLQDILEEHNKNNTSQQDKQSNIQPSISTTSKKAEPILSKIEDFGEKIGGARKDIAQEYKKKLSDVNKDDLKGKPLSKIFPRPNFKELVEAGALSLDNALFLNMLYDSIPSKPRVSYKLSRWIDTVEQVITTYKDTFIHNDKVNYLDELKTRTIRKNSLSTYYKNNEPYPLSDEQKLHIDKTWLKIQALKALGFPNEVSSLKGAEIEYSVARTDNVFTVTISNKRARFVSFEDAVDYLKGELSNPQKKETVFNIYSNRARTQYFVAKPIQGKEPIQLSETFQSSKEAFAYLRDHRDEIQAKWDAINVKPEERRTENRERRGRDWRNGQDITPDQFQETFGFRGTEFGNWVNQGERQSALNDAYDALMDLSSLLNISPKAVSLNGELGMAFGARGTGNAGGSSAAAHYEPVKIVINLTKKSGAGSLGHEWWHALDNYFSRRGGQDMEFATESTRNLNEAVRKEMKDAFDAVMKAINDSELPKRSDRLDATRSKAYWGTNLEMSARSFENYINSKLAERDDSNDYLVNFKALGEWVVSGNFEEDTFPYPTNEEAPTINEKFQQFFDTIQEKVDEETGNVVLFRSVESPESEMQSIQEKAQSDGTFMRAPNGNDTNLNERQWLQVRTKAFKDWFGDWQTNPENASKVVDENGEPKPVLHGTPNSFNSFDKSYQGTTNDPGWLGTGFYFYGNNESYAGQYSQGGEVKEVFLNVREPYFASPEEISDLSEQNSKEASSNFTDNIVSEGYDGVSYNGDLNEEWVVYEPNQIKSATDNTGAFDPGNDDIRFRSVSPAGFYSTVEDALDKIQQEKGTKDQFKAMLLKNGAKQAELDWMGFNELPAKLTKADIQKWIDTNRIEVQEVEKADINENRYIDRADAEDMFEMDHDIYGIDDNGHETLIESKDDLDNFDRFALDADFPTTEPTKYSEHTLPGGENYKELLLTMPFKSHSIRENNGKWEVINNSTGKIASIEATKEQAKGAVKFFSRIETGKRHFSSPHFEEPNTLVHIRFNEREVNGERVLFIEELQSDWAQEGRSQGFIKTYSSEILPPSQEMMDKNDYEYTGIIKDEVGRTVQTYKDFNLPKVERLLNEAIERFKRLSIPDMPFKKTDQWLNLAFRRMMRYAAENGFDRIAWTTGEQQTGRYDLSKHVDDVEYNHSTSQLIGRNKGSVVINTHATKETLPDIVGKEAAEKLLNNPQKTDRLGNPITYRLQGEELKFGGEGMKSFYDQIVPKSATKVGKPFGAKVEEIVLPEIGKQQSIPITEAVRESVMQGMPLFRSAPRLAELDQRLQEANANKQEIVWDIISELEKKYKSLARTAVVRNKEALVQTLRNFGIPESRLSKIEESGDPMQGVFSKGVIVVNAGEMYSVQDVEKTWAHETFHAWIAQNPDILLPLVDKISNGVLDKYLPKGYSRLSHRIKVEELLAYTAEAAFAGHEITNKDIKGLVNPVIEKFLNDINYGQSSKGDPDIGRRGRPDENALPDNQRSGEESTGTTRQGDRTDQSRPQDGNILSGDEGISSAEEGLIEPPIYRSGQPISEFAQEIDNYNQQTGIRFRVNLDNTNIPKPPVLHAGMTAYEVADLVKLFKEQTDEVFKDVNREMAKISGLYTAFIDRARPLEKYQALMAEKGAKMRDYTNAYADYITSASRATHLTQEYNKTFIQPLQETLNKIARSGKLKNLPGYKWNIVDEATGKMINNKEVTDYDRISLYLQAKDIVEVDELIAAGAKGIAKRGAEGFARNVHDASGNGVTPSSYITEFENAVGKTAIDNIWQKVRAVNKWALDLQLKYGLITKDTYNEYAGGTRQFYVPQRGWRERDLSASQLYYVVDKGETPDNPFNAALVKARGRETLAGDPLAYMQSIGESSVMAALKNQTKQKFLQFAEENADFARVHGFFAFKNVYYVNTGKMDDDGRAIYERTFEAPAKEQLDEDKITRKKIEETRASRIQARVNYVTNKLSKKDYDRLLLRLDKKETDLQNSIHVKYADSEASRIAQVTAKERKQHTVSVLREGKEYEIQFTQNYDGERVSNILNRNFAKDTDVDLKFMQNVNEGLRRGTRFMSAMMTQYNPTFAIANGIRDFGIGSISNLAEFGAGYQLKFMRNIGAVQPSVWRYVASDQWGGKNEYTSGYYGKMLKEFFEDGAATGWSFLKDIEQLRTDMKRAITPTAKDAVIHGKLGISNAFGLKQTFGMLTEVSELTTRFAEYVTSREQKNPDGSPKYTRQEAAIHAKEISVNFDRKGNQKFFGTLFSFFNATIQGTNKLFRMIRNPKVRNRMIGVSATLMAGGLLQALLMPDPDDDDERMFTEWELMQNLCIGKLKIPLPQGLRAFWGVGTQAGLAARGIKGIEESIMDGTNYFFGELIPEQFVFWMNGLEIDERTGNLSYNPTLAVRGAMPTTVQPLYDVWQNTNFMGGTSYRTEFTNALKDTKAERTMGKRNVSEGAQWFSDMMWQLGGGDLADSSRLKKEDTGVVAGIFDWNPSAVETLTRGYAAGTGKFVLDMVTLGRQIFDPEKKVDVSTMAIANVLWKQPREYTALDNKLWQVDVKLDFYKNQFNDIKKNNPERYQRITSFHTRENMLLRRENPVEFEKQLRKHGTNEQRMFDLLYDAERFQKMVESGQIQGKQAEQQADIYLELFKELQ